jgi:hypothetical protein
MCNRILIRRKILLQRKKGHRYEETKILIKEEEEKDMHLQSVRFCNRNF